MLMPRQVTDARESPSYQSQNRPRLTQRHSTRLISVDNVLQYASDIPSGQRRGPLPQSARLNRTPSGRHPLDPRLSGRMTQSHVPTRTSKLSEKLVLLPEAEGVDLEEKDDFLDDNDAAPPRDDELDQPKRAGGLREKSYAERLPKASRTDKLSRVTAYCTAQSYKMRATADFVRQRHGAKTKLYDDCLYTVYHLPLLPGNEGYRIQSSPVLKSPGGKAVLDEEIERNERHEYREGFFGEQQYGVRDGDGSEIPPGSRSSNEASEIQATNEDGTSPNIQPPSPRGLSREAADDPAMSRLAANLSTFAEMFIFSYGVVVFWNFTERQEKDILADLTFAASSTSRGGIPLAVRPQLQEDFETEEFHFEYNPRIQRPRVFNDMITLRSGDHMIKLAMSHAIAQSTKLSFFEERMADTMTEAQAIPRRLALQGELGMSREELVRILGRLFMSRVDVNLCECASVDVVGIFLLT